MMPANQFMVRQGRTSCHSITGGDGHRFLAASPVNTMQVDVTLAIRRNFSSVILQATRPTVRPRETTSASAFNRPVHTGRRKLIFNSSVVKLSPGPNVLAN